MLPTLTGHTATRTALAALLAGNKLPHALLFHGPRGCGESLLARHLAWRLVCGPAVADQPEDTGPDMFGTPPAPPLAITPGDLSFNATAPQAHQLAAGSCPDFHLLMPDDGKKSISVKQVTILLETLRRSADTARAIIIDSIDDLTEEAANMLLKTLEEPRPGIFFLLLSHQLSRVLPTIRSRCRLLRVSPLSLPETRSVLAQHGADETLAPLVHGCPGLALGEGGEKRLKLTQALQHWLSGQGPAPAAGSEGLVPTLAQVIAHPRAGHPPALAQALTHQRLATLMAQQAEMNLSGAMVAEVALALAKPTME